MIAPRTWSPGRPRRRRHEASLCLALRAKPEDLPISHLPRLRAAPACLALLLAGCAQEGDFGRRQPSALDPLLNLAGDQVAARRGEPVSGFMLTDAEARLRDRAWHFLMPASSRPVFDAAVIDLQRSRILPATLVADSPDTYVTELLKGRTAGGPVFGSEVRSSHSPYHRMIDDIAADASLLGPLCESVLEVRTADHVRAQSLGYVGELPASDRARASARIVENRILVGWIGMSLGRRLAAYRYGLHRLFIEIPEQDAVTAERAFSALERQVTDEGCFASAGSERAEVGELFQDRAVYKP